jgi:prevent-host-death family protein
MTRISIQDLKAKLSSAVAEAEAGHTMVITRHNAPVAQLVPAGPAHLHRGTRVGAGRITPAITRGTKGRYLTVLLEDRGTR